MSKIAAVNPFKNDVIRVKFKAFDTVLKETGMTFYDCAEFYDFGTHHRAYLAGGGDFVVKKALKSDLEDDKTYIEVMNHYDHSDTFFIYDDVIENIDIVDAAERFYSKDLKILVIRVEDEMYINGKPLIWDEEGAEEDHDGRWLPSGVDRKPYYNDNRKLLKMFENYIADLAVRESFQQPKGEDT